MTYLMSARRFETGRRHGAPPWWLALLLAWVVAVAPVLLGAHELEHLDAADHAVACDLCLTGGGLHHGVLPAAVPVPVPATHAVVTLGSAPGQPRCRYLRSGQARAPPSHLSV